MTDTRKISICIPTYNRVDMTLDSFKDVYDDERISEIVIVDDASDLELFNQLKEVCDLLPKVRLYRNLTNQDCYFNKAIAIGYATNEYAIILDSDNSIDKSYLDAIYGFGWFNDIILAPSFAKPNFDFRAFSNQIIFNANVASYIDEPMFEVALNASNYFVSVTDYLSVFDKETNPVTSDSIFQCYNWLKSGRGIQIVDGMEYNHKVHEGSHYRNNVHRTPQGFHESILNKLRQLV